MIIMKNVLPERLKLLRTEKELTQIQVAKDLGVSQNAIYNWESGKRDVSSYFIRALAIYYNVTSDFLLGLSDKRNFKE